MKRSLLVLSLVLALVGGCTELVNDVTTAPDGQGAGQQGDQWSVSPQPDATPDVTASADTGPTPDAAPRPIDDADSGVPPAPDATPTCGDGTCSVGESAASCPTDCEPVCGDGTCSVGESAASCPADCPATCGDGTCSVGESAANCPADCEPVCGDGLCAVGESVDTCPADCQATCGDGACTGEESALTCPADCPAVCGDGACTSGESALACPTDCPAVCGDGACTSGENAQSCPADCPAVCGDGACTAGESTQSCPGDCGGSCGDGACNAGESPASCPTDCPAVCGDGLCTSGESGVLCPEDCGPVNCALVEAPAPVSDAPHPGTAPGTWETTSVNGFTDDYLVRADGELKVGVRREWGATIVFFGFTGDGPGVNNTNTIDSNDTGREVQVAFYDKTRIVQSCAYNASCLSTPAACEPSITYLGWNPVQGGNECNQGSGTEWVTGDGGVLTSETIPLHWNPDWEKVGCDNGGCQDPFLKTLKSDVMYHQALRWVSDHVVEMTMTVHNLSGMDHPTTNQEFPTLYATYGSGGTPNLHVILSSTGVPIAVDEPANDGFFKKEFTSPGGWAALQNSGQSYGVGLYYENELGDFQAWQKDGVFNNFRSLFPFAIPAFGTVKGRAYLVLGGYGTIAGEVGALQTGLAPFGSVDSPQADQAIEGPTMNVSGWALDNRGVTEVRVEIDGVVAGTLGLNVTREDVCLQWPLYPGCPTVGFEGAISIAGFSPCPHLVEVIGVDTDGNERVIGNRRVYFGGAVGPQPVCGDGSCSGGESPQSCPGDCPADCGDGACTSGESHTTCPQDCPPQCGDGICSDGEDCEADCGGPQPTWDTVLIHRYIWEHMGDADHMFGTADSAPANYTYEGAAFHLYTAPGAGLVPLYQSYCEPCTDHLQGTTDGEGAPGYSGHAVLGYCSPTQTANTPNHLQRVYGADQSDHFVTTNPAEVEAVVALGYVIEGGCWVP